MGAIASQITRLTIVYSTVYSDVDQRKHQSSASLAFVMGIDRWSVNSPYKWPVTRKMFRFYDVIMGYILAWCLPVLSCPVLSRFHLHGVVLIFICTIFKQMSVYKKSAYLYHALLGLRTIQSHTTLLSVQSISGSVFCLVTQSLSTYWPQDTQPFKPTNPLWSNDAIRIDECWSILIQVVTHQAQCWFIANKKIGNILQ